MFAKDATTTFFRTFFLIFKIGSIQASNQIDFRIYYYLINLIDKNLVGKKSHGSIY